MYKVKCVKDYGVWCKEGKIIELNNYMTEKFFKSGHIKILKYLGNYPYSPYYLKQTVKNIKNQIQCLQRKLEAYEETIRELEKK